MQSLIRFRQTRKRVYKYDTDGLRTLKKIGDDEYKYTYINGQLYAYETGDMYMFFTYNDDGTPLGIIFNGITYYYQTNLQGDVIGIIRNDGEKVASYSYDAWGSPVGDVPTSGVGRYNPLRYRGYVYDEDTGWYYLQSRYYDPEVGRFINADDVAFLGASGTVLGYNLFSYCENNPINSIDMTGYAGNNTGFTVTAEGFSVGVSRCFLSQVFCYVYAKSFLDKFADWRIIVKTYRGMNAIRIAAEIWAHALVYYVGRPIINILMRLGVSKKIIKALVEKVVHTKKIDVNYNDIYAAIYMLLWYSGPVIRDCLAYLHILKNAPIIIL